MSIVNRIQELIKEQFAGESTGHDWYHIERVLNTARFIQSKEGGNLEIIELSALLHDISDHKFNGGKLNEGGKVAFDLLITNKYPEEKALEVKTIVDNVSYKGANTLQNTLSLEGQIVQDADRLDAIGAIGIARTFAYGGNRDQPIYDPELQPKMHDSFEDYANSKSSTINHFYEKLLLLKDRLNTPTGKEIGAERHQLMQDFLAQFYREWNFNNQ